jgi:hypothetical protein
MPTKATIARQQKEEQFADQCKHGLSSKPPYTILRAWWKPPGNARLRGEVSA